MNFSPSDLAKTPWDVVPTLVNFFFGPFHVKKYCLVTVEIRKYFLQRI